jgi:hypothetical protein
MKSLGLWGIGITVAFLGCGGEASPTAPPTSGGAPTNSPITSPAFDALKAQAQGHVAIEGTVTQTNIVSDLPGQASATDPHLKNAWGLAFNPSGPAWVSANGNGTSQVYDSSGNLKLEVTVPPPAGGMPPSAPTG